MLFSADQLTHWAEGTLLTDLVSDGQQRQSQSFQLLNSVCVWCFTQWSLTLTSTFEISIILIHRGGVGALEGPHQIGYDPVRLILHWNREGYFLPRNGDLFDCFVLTTLLILLIRLFWRLPDSVAIPGWLQVWRMVALKSPSSEFSEISPHVRIKRNTMSHLG